ncbi:GAF domain-containing protein [Fulvitalea axinellae]
MTLSFGILFSLISVVAGVFFYEVLRDHVKTNLETDILPYLSWTPKVHMNNHLQFYERSVRYGFSGNQELISLLKAEEDSAAIFNALAIMRKNVGLSKVNRMGVISGKTDTLYNIDRQSLALGGTDTGYSWYNKVKDKKRKNAWTLWTDPGNGQEYFVYTTGLGQGTGAVAYFMAHVNEIRASVIGLEQEGHYKVYMINAKGDLLCYNNSRLDKGMHSLSEVPIVGPEAENIVKALNDKKGARRMSINTAEGERFVQLVPLRASGMALVLETSIDESVDNMTKGFFKVYGIYFVLIIIALMVIYRVSGRFSRQAIELTEAVEDLGEGNLNNSFDININLEEPTRFIKALTKLNNRLKRAATFAQSVGKGALENEFEAKDGDELGQALIGMRDSLKAVRHKETRDRKISEDLSKLAEILRQANDLKEMSDKAVSFIVKAVDGNQAGLFTKETDEEGKDYLELSACYAYERQRFEDRRVEAGEGLTGQCLLERSRIIMTEVPDKYTKITSGLGDSTPRQLALFPLSVNETIEGVLEIATFEALDEHQIAFLEKAAEAIAATLSAVRTNERTQQLLEEMRAQAQALREKEEMSRQNFEELNATQEDFARKEKDYQAEIKRLKAELEDAEA